MEWDFEQKLMAKDDEKEEDGRFTRWVSILQFINVFGGWNMHTLPPFLTFLYRTFRMERNFEKFVLEDREFQFKKFRL